LAHSTQYVAYEIRTPADGTLAAQSSGLRHVQLAALKEITPIHTLRKSEKSLVGLVRPTEALKPKSSLRLGRTEWYRSLQLDVARRWPDGLVAAQYELALGTDDSAAAIANGMIELGRKSP
jgi:hypothetical protein